MEDEFKGLKSSNEVKRGSHCQTIQMEEPKIKLESSKEGKRAKILSKARLAAVHGQSAPIPTHFQEEYETEEVRAVHPISAMSRFCIFTRSSVSLLFNSFYGIFKYIRMGSNPYNY